MGYDSLYRKYRDRNKAIEKLKIIDVILSVISVVVIPAAAFFIIYLITKRFNFLFLIVLFGGTLAFSLFDLIKKHKNGYRYVHCSHDVRGMIKNFEAENGKGSCSYGETMNAETVFKYTLFNDARVNCSADFGQYFFTVFNDEWDEVEKFKAEREEDFEDVMTAALEFAASLEKKPDGEYDESLAPEVGTDEYKEDFEEEFEEDENEAEEEENKDE